MPDDNDLQTKSKDAKFMSEMRKNLFHYIRTL